MRTVLYVTLLLVLVLPGCAPDATVETRERVTEPTGRTGGTDGQAAPTVPPLHPSIDGYPEAVLSLAGPGGAAERVAVKVADTSARRQHGLMEVEDLPDGTGMLFVFGEDHQGGFWMKDTLVALSIAFADADGDILDILEMEPCEEEPCPVYDPGVSYRYALEVPQGWFAEVGVTEDWTIERPPPAPSD